MMEQTSLTAFGGTLFRKNESNVKRLLLDRQKDREKFSMKNDCTFGGCWKICNTTNDCIGRVLHGWSEESLAPLPYSDVSSSRTRLQEPKR
mmetsp:Transcript_118682/g.177398  ORF Transcript_118682/g.177398 Transcript_118682/m.177398 type:complete len:91 (+) Transcript_118682:518-790(+)